MSGTLRLAADFLETVHGQEKQLTIGDETFDIARKLSYKRNAAYSVTLPINIGTNLTTNSDKIFMFKTDTRVKLSVDTQIANGFIVPAGGVVLGFCTSFIYPVEVRNITSGTTASVEFSIWELE